MMNKVENLISKWGGFKFSSGGTTGSDYLQFQKEFRSVLSTIAKKAGYKIHIFCKNHYMCSAMLEEVETGAIAYVSIPDVRFWQDGWANKVLYRQARDANDWTGLENHYCCLDELGDGGIVSSQQISYF